MIWGRMVGLLFFVSFGMRNEQLSHESEVTLCCAAEIWAVNR